MGSEIHKTKFTEQDYEAFENVWNSELEFVKTLFSNPALFSNTYRLGYELEACILDEHNQPAPINQNILNDLSDSHFTSELANYDLEINGNVFDIGENTAIELENDLATLWSNIQESALKFNTHLGLFGIFPNLMPQHFDREHYQSQMLRYTMASTRIHELRHESIRVLLHGEDEILMERDDVMSEALCTSFQIHFQVPFIKAVEYYHAALLASVVMTGIGANSSIVLGKRAWHESRIPIFEQSVDVRDQERRKRHDETRVHFAHGYIDSWLDLYEQNKNFTILFPDIMDTDPSELHHFNLHNGTIWRWIRPILAYGKDGKWSLRLELRVLPSGPSLIDMEANCWFFIGLIHALVISGIDLQKVPFNHLKHDFYTVAKYGLQSEFHEPYSGNKTILKDWIVSKGIQLAQNGLQSLGIENFQNYLDIIKQRATNGQSGAVWQLKHFEKYQSIEKLVEEYLNNFERNIPVHTWSI